MKSSKLLFIALLAAALSVSAQERKTYVYEGRVVNESGIPIKDAVVKAIETNVSATTEYDGLFSLTLPIKGDSIVITKEGLATFSGRTTVKTIEKPVQKIIEKIIQAPDGSLEKQVTKEYNPEFIYEPLEKEVIVLGPLQASRMTVESYTKKMAETATKYYEAGLNFLSGDAPDYMKAFACFTRAANMEHNQAAYQLAKMYDEGLGIPQDYGKAIKWYKRLPYNKVAAKRLAIMYMEGIGTEQDDIMARNYLYNAISAGDTIEAQKLLDGLFAKHKDEMGESASNDVYDMVETNAQFPGGDAECLKFIAAHVKYPTICQEQGVQGRVLVSFVVNKDGSIVEVKAVRSPDPNLAKEAERVINLMPKWVPAMQGWKNVRSRFNLPVMFRLH